MNLKVVIHALDEDLVHRQLPQTSRGVHRRPCSALALDLDHCDQYLGQGVHEGRPLHKGLARDALEGHGDGHQTELGHARVVLHQRVHHKDLVHGLGHGVIRDPLHHSGVNGPAVHLPPRQGELAVHEGGAEPGVKVPHQALVHLVELEALVAQHVPALRGDLQEAGEEGEVGVLPGHLLGQRHRLQSLEGLPRQEEKDGGIPQDHPHLTQHVGLVRSAGAPATVVQGGVRATAARAVRPLLPPEVVKAQKYLLELVDALVPAVLVLDGHVKDPGQAVAGVTLPYLVHAVVQTHQELATEGAVSELLLGHEALFTLAVQGQAKVHDVLVDLVAFVDDGGDLLQGLALLPVGLPLYRGHLDLDLRSAPLGARRLWLVHVQASDHRGPLHDVLVDQRGHVLLQEALVKLPHLPLHALWQINENGAVRA